MEPHPLQIQRLKNSRFRFWTPMSESICGVWCVAKWESAPQLQAGAQPRLEIGLLPPGGKGYPPALNSHNFAIWINIRDTYVRIVSRTDRSPSMDRLDVLILDELI